MFAPAGAKGSARRGLPKSSSYLRVARLVRVEPSRDEILKALEQVIDPELRRPVTELDMVRDIRIDGSDVSVTIVLTVAGCRCARASRNRCVSTSLRCPVSAPSGSTSTS